MRRQLAKLAGIDLADLQEAKEAVCLIDAVLDIEFHPLNYNGDPRDIYDFSKTSMYYNNDPFIIIENCYFRQYRKNQIDGFVKSVMALIENKEIEPDDIPLSCFSGLTNAKEQTDWPNLQEYGNSLIPRSDWNVNQTNYYGFDTELDFQKRKHEVESNFSSGWYLSWNKRYYFGNDGVSHRLAAYCRQDREQIRNETIRLSITRKSINPDIHKEIFGNYYCVFVERRTYDRLFQLLKSICLDLPVYDSSNEQVKILWIAKDKGLATSMLIKFLRTLRKNIGYVFDGSI